MKQHVIRIALLFFYLPIAMSQADERAPVCLSHGQELPVDNARVLELKRDTRNQFHARAHILGTLVRNYHDHSNHHHLEVRIADSDDGTIEIVYNEDFGSVPDLRPGEKIEACGDYITADARTGHYPPSPDGAIMHWVHASPSSRHESGFLVIDGVLCGQRTHIGAEPIPDPED